MCGRNVIFQDRMFFLPWPADRNRSEPSRHAANFEYVGNHPPRAPVNGIVNNLAVHFLTKPSSQREDFLWCSRFASQEHNCLQVTCDALCVRLSLSSGQPVSTNAANGSVLA